MVRCTSTFDLTRYLKNIKCNLTLDSGVVIALDHIEICEDRLCKLNFETMAYDFWAMGIGELPVIKDQLGLLSVDYHLSFTGHPKEAPSKFELVVPLLKRTTKYLGM